jgi:type IV pilus assembly protein PilE
MWPRGLERIALKNKTPGSSANLLQGMTLIELVIVVAIMAILLTLAVPSYQSYMLRVHRSEAIRMLMQASMCQERIHANHGRYDTGQCQAGAEQQHYRLTYESPNQQGQRYVASAVPQKQQLADSCGSLSLNQNGMKSISTENISVTKCWNGR